jgi:hypothetical protein
VQAADQDVAPGRLGAGQLCPDLPDGRRFANDSRRLLYLLDRTTNQPTVYANVSAAF